MGHDYSSETEQVSGGCGVSGSGLKIALVVSDFNAEITSELERGAKEELLRLGVAQADIRTVRVPGAFELPLGAQSVLERNSSGVGGGVGGGGIDAVVCLGCVIRGETSHYDFICNSCATALQKVALKYNKPVIAGVLTTENIEQARARCGGEKGHKGRFSALAALRMIDALTMSKSNLNVSGANLEKETTR